MVMSKKQVQVHMSWTVFHCEESLSNHVNHVRESPISMAGDTRVAVLRARQMDGTTSRRDCKTFDPTNIVAGIFVD